MFLFKYYVLCISKEIAMNTLDDAANDSAMLSEASTADEKQYKTSRYSKLKEDPEAFAIYK